MIKRIFLFNFFVFLSVCLFSADLTTQYNVRTKRAWNAGPSVLCGVDREDTNFISPVVVGPDGCLQTNCYPNEVATSKVFGTLNYYKFGFGEIGTAFEAVWDGANETGVTGYNYITDDFVNGTKLWLSSKDANDAAADTGARSIYVEGLDADWELINETVSLNGQLTVETTNTYKRVFRMYVVTAGSSGVNENDIYAHRSAISSGEPTDKGKFYAKITQGYGQTLMSVYTVPKDKYALATAYTRGVGQGKESTIRIVLRSVQLNAWNVKFVDQLYESTTTQVFAYPTYVPEMVDFEVQAKTGTGTVLVQSSLGFLLVDER